VSSSTLLWLPWMAGLSVLAGWLALRAWRRSDGIGALRWSGWALVPPALLLTGSVGLVGRVAEAVTSWAANLVVNPLTWAGVIVGGVAVVMIGTAAALRRRRGPAQVEAPAKRALKRSGRSGPTTGTAGPAGPAAVDDDMAEIEEILRRRSIG
jgi:hypothetical protein